MLKKWANLVKYDLKKDKSFRIIDSMLVCYKYNLFQVCSRIIKLTGFMGKNSSKGGIQFAK